jgi:predicted house-cleaning noncanonical NTP pyrophosphatase (MazG superfamily)
MVHYGLNKYETEKILKEYLNKEPDLKYYLDNDYMEKLVDVLIEGIAKVIEENNEKVEKDIKRELRGF